MTGLILAIFAILVFCGMILYMVVAVSNAVDSKNVK